MSSDDSTNQDSTVTDTEPSGELSYREEQLSACRTILEKHNQATVIRGYKFIPTTGPGHVYEVHVENGAIDLIDMDSSEITTARQLINYVDRLPVSIDDDPFFNGDER